MLSISPQKPSGLYNKVNFKNRVNSVYNRYTKVNLLSMVKLWQNQTKNLKLEPPAPPPAPLQLQKSPAFSNGIFKPVLKFEVDKLNQPIVINQYTLTKLLGKGAQGIVKLASDTKRLYAVKVINCEKLKKKFFIKKKELQQMLRVEVDILRQLNHPNIVQFYEALYSQECERLYIVLEYCSKGSLLGYLQTKEEGDWEGLAKRVCYELCLSIAYMHDLQLVHRDIKTQNLLLSQTKSAKLCDFNISTKQKKSQLQPVNTFLGTKLYSPPQLVISSREVYSPYSADIWSLAITMLEIYTKKHPFESMNLQQLEAAIIQPIQFNEKVQGKFRELMEGMLQVDWRRRVGMAEVLGHAWWREGGEGQAVTTQAAAAITASPPQALVPAAGTAAPAAAPAP